jgi:hypothetical protein
MKKLLVLSSIALLYASLGWAQDSSAQPSAQSPNSAADSSSTTSGTVQGCLNGSEGNYTLTQDTTGTVFKLAGSTDKLKEHVGHEVAVTGQMSGDSGSATSPSSGSSDSNASAGPTFQVSDVKMVSKHCASGSDAPQSR